MTNNNDNNSSIQKEQQPPSGSHSDSGQPISGTILKAVIVYLLPHLKVKPDKCGDVISGTGDQKAKLRFYCYYPFVFFAFLLNLKYYFTCRPAIKDYNLCKQTNNYFVT